MLQFTSTPSIAGSTETLDARIGDTFTIYTTPHYYTQSVLWEYDPAVLEPQTTIYGTTTSVTFKVINNTVSRSAITATTYYHKSGTTSSGINKDVDLWYINISASEGSDDSDKTTIHLNKSSLSMKIGDSASIIAYPSDSSYSGGYEWESSNPSVVTLVLWGSRVEVRAESAGMTYISATLDNGNSAKVLVNVSANQEDDTNFVFSMTTDGVGYSVAARDKSISGNLKLPDSYKGKPVTEIKANGFEDCTLISTITIPNSIKKIGNFAFTKSSIKNIDIPNSVTVLGNGAFYRCDQLNSVTLSNSLTVINEYTFERTSIKTINIPGSVKSINKSAFFYCRFLEKICLPNSLKKLGSFAFADCESLENIYLPGSLSDIEYGIFNGCFNIKNIYYDTTNPISKGIYDIFDEITPTMTLHIPAEGLDVFKKTTPWNQFKNIVTYGSSSIEEAVTNICDYTRIKVYNLQGIFVGSTLEGLDSGIYIVWQGNKIQKVAVK